MKIRIRRPRIRSMLVKYLISYITLTLAVTLCVGVIAVRVTTSSYQRQLEHAQAGMLEQYSALFESGAVSPVDAVFQNLLSASRKRVRVRELLAEDEISSEAVTRMFADMKELVATTPGVDAIAIYDCGKNVLLSTDYGIKYLGDLPDSMAHCDAWIKAATILASQHAVLPVTEYEFGLGNVRRVVTFVRSYPPFQRLNAARGALAIELDEAFLRGMLLGLRSDDNTELFIADAQGNVVSTTAEEAPRPPEDIGLWEEGRAGGRVSGTDYVAYSAPMRNGWRVLSRTPLSAFYSSVYGINAVLIRLCAAALALGVCVAVYFSVQLYTPLKAMTALLRKSVRAADVLDDYTLIGSMISGLNAQISFLHLRIDKNLPLLRSDLALSLINGTLHSQESFRQRLELADITVPAGPFCALAVVNIQGGVIDHLSETGAHLIKTDLTRMLESFGSSRCATLICETRPGQIASLCIGDAEVFASVFDGVEDYVAQNYPAVVFACVGEAESDPCGIHRSFAALERLSRQRFFHPQETVLRLRPEQPPPALDELEADFLRGIKAGDLENTLRPLSEMCARMRAAWTDPDWASARVAHWAEVFCGLAAHRGAEANRLCAGFMSEFPRLENIGAFERRFKELVCGVYALDDELGAQRAARMVEDIKARIEEALDGDLSLGALAENAGISASYLSKLFRRAEGTSIARYIIKRRMARAKKLLATTELSVERIAEMVGYPTHHNFTRMFRETFAITPKRYREQAAYDEVRENGGII